MRSLEVLERVGSTARVLNLNAIAQREVELHGDVHVPFFSNRRLNRSIIVKHRVRDQEQCLFRERAAHATKVMFPIDPENLGVGAWFLMLGQRDFDAAAEALVGSDLKPGRADRIVLQALAGLPSLDPFLVREALRRHGHAPSREYFRISEADIDRMHEFVRNEIESLVRMSAGTGAPGLSARLVEKLLSTSAGDDLEPLKHTLRLSEKSFLDGMFAWRGFLYYKWSLSRALCLISNMIAEMDRISACPGQRGDVLQGSSDRIKARISRSVREAHGLLCEYDRSYGALVQGDAPTRFRDFILDAPDMFMRLGEACGVLQDATSYWRFLKPKLKAEAPRAVLAECWADFEACLQLSAG